MEKGRVESWGSGYGPISSSPSSNRTFGFSEYGFLIIFFQRLSQFEPRELCSESGKGSSLYLTLFLQVSSLDLTLSKLNLNRLPGLQAITLPEFLTSQVSSVDLSFCYNMGPWFGYFFRILAVNRPIPSSPGRFFLRCKYAGVSFDRENLICLSFDNC